MSGEIKNEMIESLKGLKDLLIHGDAITGDLRELSNDLMEDVTVSRNKDSITISYTVSFFILP